jgi:hypothetical protein
MVLDRFDIPASARVLKPIFPELPRWEIVEEVRAWVRSGNPTFTWRGHTHTSPERGEPIEYVGEFRLAKGTEAPCPCCTPETPKFNVGLVAWFPRTKLVRLMGQHCFRRLNPEGHRTAYENLQERQRRKATIDYLINNLPKKPEAESAIERAIPIARHLDDLHDILGPKLKGLMGIDLWQILRDGLKVVTTDTSGRQFLTDYARIEGRKLIDPAHKKIRPSLETALRGLKGLQLPADLEPVTDAERESIARKFRRAIAIARDTFSSIDECRRFVSIQNTATVRSWGALPHATASLYLRRDGRTLLVGTTEEDARSISLDAAIDSVMPRLPDVSL